MGWWSRRDTTPSIWREEIIEDATRSGRIKVIEHKMTCYGTHLWMLIEHRDTKQRLVCFVLFRRHYDREWAYKDMDENMHPYFYDCPMSLIEKAGPTTNENALLWREKVKEYHARRQARRAQ